MVSLEALALGIMALGVGIIALALSIMALPLGIMTLPLGLPWLCFLSLFFLDFFFFFTIALAGFFNSLDNYCEYV